MNEPTNHKQTNGLNDKMINHKETNGLPKSPVSNSTSDSASNSVSNSSSPIVHHINIERESTTAASNESSNLNKEQSTKNTYEIPTNATDFTNLPKGAYYKVPFAYVMFD